MKMLQTGSRYLFPAPDIMTDKWPWRPRPPTFQQWVAPLMMMMMMMMVYPMTVRRLQF